MFIFIIITVALLLPKAMPNFFRTSALASVIRFCTSDDPGAEHVHDEVGMLRRDHRAAGGDAAQSGFGDQLAR